MRGYDRLARAGQHLGRFRAILLTLGMLGMAGSAASAQDGAASSQGGSREADSAKADSAKADSAEQAMAAAHRACIQLNPYIERIVADSIQDLRRKGKLQAIIDSLYPIALRGGGVPISREYNKNALPDSVRALAALAGPSCTLMDLSIIPQLIRPELQHFAKARADSIAKAKASADSSREATPKPVEP